MSEEFRESVADGDPQERRSGEDRRRSSERRKENRGVWNVPVLKRLVDRRKDGDRRSGAERRHD